VQALADNKILIGRVNGLFGVRGWLRFFSYTRPPANLISYNPLWLKTAQGWQAFEVESSQAYADGRLVAKFKGVDERETARVLMGCDVAIMPEQLPKEDPTDYYWVDLIGCRVENQSGELLGVVKEMMETGAHDVMRVSKEKSDELIPFVLDLVVKQVDLAQKLIRVDWESGYFNESNA
jgi:16S rRNA processing protein RimM